MDETDEKAATRSCDPGRRLVTLAPITDVRRRAQAERDFELWHDRGLRCLETFSFLLERGHLRQAAFDLFQATEAFYGALLMVFVGDKPWTHDLRMLRRMAAQCDPLLTHVFPEASSEDKRPRDRCCRCGSTYSRSPCRDRARRRATSRRAPVQSWSVESL